MKVFITGASGFIGSYVFRNLIQAGHTVLSMKRSTTNLWRIDDCISKADWIEDSVSLDDELCKFVPDVIINLAWNGVAAKDRTDWAKQGSNILMQQRLLDIALKCGTKKFIGAGSQAEYGTFENKIDETYPANPNSAYGAVKYSCLTMLKTFCEINHIEWYWFRIFPCFGPMEDENWLIPSLIKNVMTEDHMDLTLGEQKLAYLYVGEVANSITSPIACLEDKSGVYNICSDNPRPLKEMVSSIRDLVDPGFQLNFGALQYRYGQCMYMEGDTARIKKNLYKIDSSSYDNRMKQTIEYYIEKFRHEII